MQDILDRKYGGVVAVDDSSSDGGSDDDSSNEEDLTPMKVNSNYSKAEEELMLFESWKAKRYRPVFDTQRSVELVGEESADGKARKILVGPVLTKGKNLPSGKNLADYVDCRGRIDLVELLEDHQKYFGVIWKVVQKNCTRNPVEIGCERFFSLAGYVSDPRRTRLGVRTYERLALLAAIVNKVYIDKEWVAQEYLRRCKAGAWKSDLDEDAAKCWNLERILDAELVGGPTPVTLTVADLLGEGTDAEVGGSGEGGEEEEV